MKLFPRGFSFVGVRFFPVLFGTLSAPLFFFILYKLSRRPFISFLFSSLYLFENALIVQSRGALLESTQIFFILCALLYFLYTLELKKVSLKRYFVLGVLVGLGIAVKLNALVFLLLLPFLILYEKKYLFEKVFWGEVLLRGEIFLAGTLIIYLGVFYIHIALGEKILDSRTYLASGTYEKAMSENQEANPLYFPVAFKDNLAYAKQYEQSVPQYDPGKTVEDGSLPITWPFGDKSIRYLWEKDGKEVRYLYFQGNPLIWLTGFAGVILAFILIVSHLIFKLEVKNKRIFFLITTLFSLYILYMVSSVWVFSFRVLYIYHYLIPLLFSLFLAFLIFIYIFEKALKRNNRRLYIGTVVFVFAIFFMYRFFSPLTYFQPLAGKEVFVRNWFSFWHLYPILFFR